MLDKLEKHNNKKLTYVVNRRIRVIKDAILSFFTSEKDNETAVFNNNSSVVIRTHFHS